MQLSPTQAEQPWFHIHFIYPVHLAMACSGIAPRVPCPSYTGSTRAVLSHIRINGVSDIISNTALKANGCVSNLVSYVSPKM